MTLLSFILGVMLIVMTDARASIALFFLATSLVIIGNFFNRHHTENKYNKNRLRSHWFICSGVYSLFPPRRGAIK